MPTQEKKKNASKKRLPYFNRELSWLAFNRRVLEQAQNENYPILERVRFLAFVSKNLDEFFEIRVAGILQQIESGIVEKGLDGLGPKEQLRRIHSIVTRLVADQYACWSDQLVPALKKEGVVFKRKNELSRNEKKWVKEYFDEEVYPVLTPLAVDPAHPFPQLVNKALNILALLENPHPTEENENLMAIIPIPRILPRVVEIQNRKASKSYYQPFIFLSDIVRMNAHKLFPGYRIRYANPIRVTRNSDLYFDEEEVENLLQKIEEELYKLRRGAAVRLEIRDEIDENLLREFLEAINLKQENVFRINGPLNMVRLMSIYDLIDRDDLKFSPFQPYIPQNLHNVEPIFDEIKKSDILLHHPFESFQPVVDFLKQASTDPRVFAIKQTLYRTSGDSPIVNALIKASENGKQVTALVEVKARFDEANNIQWARQLEEAGVHVVYGMVGLKTHCKCSLVVRRESDGLRRYAHLGTGNYNPKTARLYTDFSFFTSREPYTTEVADLFNSLTGFALEPKFTKLLVAPFNLHSTIQKLILREARHARAGKPARIIAKCNSLIDQETINSLYKASQAGVQIDLIIRGICGLVPGVRGLSENIKVRSILGRYLEHSRIFYFQNGHAKPDIYMGSADWMPRNFFRRIECLFPLEEISLRQRVMDVLNTYLRDNANSKILRSNGAYAPPPKTKDELFSAQNYFMGESNRLRKEAEAKLLEEKADTSTLQINTSSPLNTPPPRFPHNEI